MAEAARLMVMVGADVTKAVMGLNMVSDKAQGMGGHMHGAGLQAQSLTDKLMGLSTQAGVLGMGLSFGVTLPLVGLGKAALGVAMDYESSMNLMQAVSGATATQMQQVAKVAKELGADMTLPATSAADAAKAMTELAKGGLSVEQAMAAAKGTLMLAAAAQIDEAQAAVITADALNAFKLPASEAGRITDLLAAAANSATGEITDYADGLQMASAVFAAAKIPAEELVTELALMANAGIKGSDAGTSLKQMILSLQAPTKKSANLMAELGISIYDSNGAMRPMPAIARQFQRSLSGLTAEQRDATLAAIFGSDAVRAANIVLMAGADEHEKMFRAVTKEGAAATLAAARMKGLAGALQGLQSQVETLLLNAAEPFLGTLEGLIRGVADFLPGLGNVSPALVNAGLAFAGVLAAAGPVLLAFAGLTAAAAFLISPIGLVTLGIASLTAALAGNLGGLRDWLAGFADWGYTLEIFKSFGRQIATAIAAGDFSEVGRVVSRGITMAVNRAGEIAADLTSWIGGEFAKIDWGLTWRNVKGVGEAIGKNVASIADDVTKWLGEQWAKVDWEDIWKKVKGVGEAIGKNVASIADDVTKWLGEQWAKVDWEDIWKKATGLISQGKAFIEKAVPEFSLKLQQWGQAFIAWVGPTLFPMWQEMNGIGTSVQGWITQQAPVFGRKLVLEWSPQFWGWVSTTATPGLLKELTLMQEAGIKHVDENAYQWGLAGGRAGTEVAVGFTKMAVFDAVPALAQSIYDLDQWVKTNNQLLTHTGMAVASGIIDGIKLKMQEWAWEWMRWFVEKLLEAFRGAAPDRDANLPPPSAAPTPAPPTTPGPAPTPVPVATPGPDTAPAPTPPENGGVPLNFAQGGAFQVGGVGGIDSRLVAFRATPGELVTVSPNGASATGITVNVYVQGSVIAERDLAMRVREELLKHGRRNVSIFGGLA